MGTAYMTSKLFSRFAATWAVAVILAFGGAVASVHAASEENPGVQIREYWKKALTKCFTDYYRFEPWSETEPPDGQGRFKAFEYQGVGFKLIGGRVSADDKAAGIDWRGTARVTFTVWRYRDPKHIVWSDWFNAGDLFRDVEVMRKNGVVMFKPAEDGAKFVTLADVPDSHPCPAD
jgi:hypothetical protein